MSSPPSSSSSSSSMSRKEMETYLRKLKMKANVRMYTPYKYFAGLKTKAEVRSRFQEIRRGRATASDDPRAYKTFRTDVRRPTKTSKYTKAFYETYGCDMPRSMVEKSRITGVPLDILRRVYNKGKAAWRTGHRVGANEEQWGYARVHSFLTLGCTVFTSDAFLFEEALRRMTPSKRRKWLSLPIRCSKSTFETPYYRRRHAYDNFMKLKQRYLK